MAGRAVAGLVAQWLPELGGRAEDVGWVTDEVTLQIAALPAPLRIAVGTLGTVLSPVPASLSGRLAALPGTGEFVRLVRSLATVVYLGEKDAHG